MNIPATARKELLEDQLRSAGHSSQPTDGVRVGSVAVVLATHARTTETIAAIESVRRAFATSRYPIADIIVFVDEDAASRAATTEALAALDPSPVVIGHGDGDVYWARAFAELLQVALATDAEFIVHLNSDVVLTASPDPLIAAMDDDPTVGAVAATLDGDVRLTGYRRVRPWFPFFRSVPAGSAAWYLPASCVAIRCSALRSPGISLESLAAYRHGWADIELSCQLRESGYRLLTTTALVGAVGHQRYFRRVHHFERFGGSLLRYLRECPTAPCLADTRRFGRRVFGPLWPIAYRVYVPVAIQYVRFRWRRV